MAEASKPIGKTDDDSKRFIIDCLSSDKTHGFDVDSLYFYQGQWCLFEYLKCESPNVTPHTSDPKYYPYNWRKFYCLYCLAKQLRGRLFLVNYSMREQDREQVKVMEVLSFDCETVRTYEQSGGRHCNYLGLKSWKTDRKTFSDWLRQINREAGLPPMPEESGDADDEIPF